VSASRAPVAELFAGVKVIDVDTHLTEPHDLWTSRAPRGFEDRRCSTGVDPFAWSDVEYVELS